MIYISHDATLMLNDGKVGTLSRATLPTLRDARDSTQMATSSSLPTLGGTFVWTFPILSRKVKKTLPTVPSPASTRRTVLMLCATQVLKKRDAMSGRHESFDTRRLEPIRTTCELFLNRSATSTMVGETGFFVAFGIKRATRVCAWQCESCMKVPATTVL